MVRGVQLVLDTLREPIEQMGFRKRGGEVFTIALADEVIGWLGLNYASRHRRGGQVEVNPVVGIRHQVIERLVAKLRQERFHEYQPPTVSVPIGYIMPAHRYISWEFGGHRGTTAGADVLAAIADHGIPFMRSIIQLPDILNAINRGFCNYPEYRLPAVLEKMGRHEDARMVLARAVDELGERNDAAAEQLRHFAAAFSDEVNNPISSDRGNEQ